MSFAEAQDALWMSSTPTETTIGGFPAQHVRMATVRHDPALVGVAPLRQSRAASVSPLSPVAPALIDLTCGP